MNRYERVLKLIADENITIENVEVYKELLGAVDDAQFETHIEAIKDMCADAAKKYILEAKQDENGNLSVDYKSVDKSEEAPAEEAKADAEVVDEKSEAVAEEAPAEEKKEEVVVEKEEEVKNEETPAVEEEPKVTEATEEKKEEVKEEKPVDDSIAKQMAEILAAVSDGKKVYEQVNSNIAALKSEMEAMMSSVTSLRKKYKDLEDTLWTKSKKLLIDTKKSASGVDEIYTEEVGSVFEDVFPEHLRGN